MVLRSVNGAAVTVIQGYRAPAPIDDGSYSALWRCVYLADGAALDRFHADQRDGQPWRWRVVRIRQCGRVQLCADRQLGGVSGGGANGGTLNNCTLSGNSAYLYGGRGGAITARSTTARSPATRLTATRRRGDCLHAEQLHAHRQLGFRGRRGILE